MRKQRFARLTECVALSGLLCIGVCGCREHKETFDPSQVEPVSVTIQPELRSSRESLPAYAAEDADVLVPVPLKETIRLFEEQGTGIVLYSEEDCLWCEKAVPLLAEACRLCGTKAYHVNTAGTIKPEDYDALCKYIDATFISDADGKQTFYLPEVIAVKNGEIIDWHISLTEDYRSEEAEELSEEQRLEMLKIYTGLIASIKDE
ncbi:MAG: hypothetical protein IKS37_06555 [Solobacterium sp.]|nr:hypothetical protein [Solobacterium sp.]